MRSRPLLLLTLAALALRIAFVLLEPATRLAGDERTWIGWGVEGFAAARLSPTRVPLIFYPPLYPYLIAAAYLAFGTLQAVKWIQAVLSALMVPATFRIGELAFGTKVGVVAGALTAFYPELIWFSAHFWSETLFMFLMWWALERALSADLAGSVSAAAIGGALWGLAALTRETALYFAPVVAVWLAVNRRLPGGGTRAAAFLLAVVLVVAPWTWRNWIAFHAFVPVSTAGGLNLFQGNSGLSRQEVYDRYEAVPGRIEQYHYARDEGLRAIRDRQPAWLFEKLVEQMPNFWEADSLALIHMKRGAYGAVPGFALVLATLVVLIPYLLVLAFFIAGCAALSLDRPRVLLVALLAYYNLIHVVTHGFARYRLPVMPAVFLVAAGAWVAWRDGALPALSPARRVVGWAVAVGLSLCLVPSFQRTLRQSFVEQEGRSGQDATRP
jgi:hypothetical protein